MTSEPGDDDFNTSVRIVTRLVTQMAASAEATESVLLQALASPVRGTPAAEDVVYADRANHEQLLGQAARMLETHSYAFTSSLQYLKMHLTAGGDFHPVPCLNVTRSLLEYAAAMIWQLDADATPEMRLARSAASTLRALESTIKELDGFPATRGDAEKAREQRREVHDLLTDGGATLTWVTDKKGQLTEVAASVSIGGHEAKSRMPYAQMVRDQIDSDAPYGVLSAVVHGSPYALESVRTMPATMVRAIASSSFSALIAWRTAVANYTGTTFAPPVNPQDLAALRQHTAERNGVILD